MIDRPAIRRELTVARRAAAVALAIIVASVTSAPSSGALAAGPPTVAHPEAAEVGATSRFEAHGPHRLADTRSADCGCTRLDASTIRVQVAGRSGLPDSLVAAAVTVTASGAAGGGYVTIAPSGVPRPEASMLNVSAGSDAANSAIVPVGDDGAIELYSSVATELIVDVTGAFVPAASSRAGRFVAVAPRRLLDTRTGRPPAPGSELRVPLPAGVDPDATALAVNVTSVDAVMPGYLSAYPAGAAGSPSSFLNPDGSGAPRASAMVVPVSPDGLAVTTSAGGHVLVDVVGWFTGPSAPTSDDGLFVPSGPSRMLDTRASGERLWRGGTVEVIAPGADVAAVVTNVTLDRSDAAGYLTAYPAGTPLPGASTVNAVTRDHTVANFAITPTSTRGTAYFSDSGTDLLVDLTGWFTGTPVPATLPPAPNDRPPSRVMLVGDSTMAGIRWYGEALSALQGFDSIVDVESCRRLVRPSCKGREDRVPTTAVEAIRSVDGWLDVVVVMTGYNDWFSNFDAEFAAVVGTARAKGAREIVWLRYREGPGEHPDATRAYRQNNAALARVVATGAYPDVTIADWPTYSSRASGWFIDDGIHFTIAGAYGNADYVARWVAHLEGRPCPMPWTPGGETSGPCPRPDTATPPDVMELYSVTPTNIHCYEVGADRHVECKVDTEL